MAQVVITNLTADPLSLDFAFDDEVVREKLDVGGSVDIGDRVSIDDVNRNATVKSLIAAGKISVTSSAESDDVDEDLPNKSVFPRDIDAIQSAYLGAPVLADVDRIVDELDPVANGALSVIAQPDVPRNITVTVVDADDSVTTTCVVVGTDPAGRAVTETAQVTLGVGKSFVGTKIFASVTSATVSGTSGAAAGDTISVGVGDVIGLPTDIQAAGAVKHAYLAGTKLTPDAVATGVSTSGVDCSGGTYDGSKVLQVFYNLGD